MNKEEFSIDFSEPDASYTVVGVSYKGKTISVPVIGHLSNNVMIKDMEIAVMICNKLLNGEAL